MEDLEDVPNISETAARREWTINANASCSVCRNLQQKQDAMPRTYQPRLFLDPIPASTWPVHVDQLRDSASSGCSFCQTLLTGYEKFLQHVVPTKHQRNHGPWNHGPGPKRWHLTLSGIETGTAARTSSWQGWQQRFGRDLNDLTIELRPVGPVSLSSSARGARVEFFTAQGEAVYQSFGESNIVETTLTIDLLMGRLSTWLAACDETHPLCKETAHSLPSRLVLVPHEPGGTPRLVEMNDTHHGRYMTLSHCWGQDEEKRPLRTTKSTLRKHQNGIHLEGSHQMFKDAFEIARRLGIQYVWIDSICIIQDDADDWTYQAGQMAEIYSNSYLNVAATALPNSNESLFRKREIRHGGAGPRLLRTHSFSPPTTPGLTASPMVHMRESHRRDHHHVRSDNPEGRQDAAPMLERGWIFQERLLSRRSVHFCASEIIWECRTAYDCECGAMALETDVTSAPLFNSSSSPASMFRIQDEAFHKIPRKHKFSHAIHAPPSERRIDVYDLWLELVDAYSGLAISRHKDRFFALAGIGKAICSQLSRDEQYLAGLWSGDLLRGLLWEGIPGSQSDIRREAMAPTWSWMSRNWFRPEKGGSKSIAHYTLFKGEGGFVFDERVVVHRAVCEVEDEDAPFGPVNAGTGVLELSAVVLAGSLRGDSADDHRHHGKPASRGSGLAFTRPEPRPRENLSTIQLRFKADCPGPDGDRLQDGEDVVCALMGQTSGKTNSGFKEHALVLRADSACKDTDRFQRVGILEIAYDNVEHASIFSDAAVQSFKLA